MASGVSLTQGRVQMALTGVICPAEGPAPLCCAAQSSPPLTRASSSSVRFSMLISRLFLKINLITDSTTECANDQEGNHKKCIFPFIRSHNMMTYDSCSDVLAKDGYEWCATLVDDSGIYESGSLHWGKPCGPCEIPPGILYLHQK